MYKRIAAILATMVAVLMAVGIGSAVVGPAADDSASATSTTSPAATSPTPAMGETVQYEVGDAGTVTVLSHGGALSIVGAEAADGWSVEVEAAAGREVEADFRKGSRRIQFNAELEDGQVRVRVRERNDDNGGTGDSTTVIAPPATVSPTSVPSTSVPSTSVPSTSVPSTSVPSTTVPSTSSTVPPDGDKSSSTVTYQAGDGGSVTISSSGSSLTIVSIHPAAGWSFEVEIASGREVEADFRKGSRRIQFDAELEDGQVRIRVRDRNN